MARSLSRRGRMRSDDERRMQINSLFIEHEVDARDLAGPLYAGQIIDSNDRDEILAGGTRLERTRRMIDILLLRGPEAYDTFLRALDDTGYDHVAVRLRTTEVMMTPKNSYSDLDPFLRGAAPLVSDLDGLIREASGLSVSSRDPGMLSERLKTFEATCLSLPAHEPGGLSERLKKVEDLWDILSRRVTRIERRVEPTPSISTTTPHAPTAGKEEEGAEKRENNSTPIGEEELKHIKEELAQLKTDTLAQVEELTSANTQKAALIEDLLGEVEQKTEQLKEAQGRIEELEQRIEQLENEKARSMQEVGSLREALEQHEQQVKHQEEWFNAENLRLRNKLFQQEKALTDQEQRVTDLQTEEGRMKKILEDQQEDLKEQRRLMEEQSYQLGLLTKHVINITNNTTTTTNNTNKNNNHNISNKKDINVINNTAPDTDPAPPDSKPPRNNSNDVRDVTRTIVAADVNVLPAEGSTAKPHTAHLPAKNLPKNHFTNHLHRTSFNASNTASNNVVVTSSSSAVCLNVPASANPAVQYRGNKRSAPAPNFRGFNRRK